MIPRISYFVNTQFSIEFSPFRRKRRVTGWGLTRYIQQVYTIDMKRLNLYITIKQYEALRKLAQNGLKVSEHIRRAIDEYLERQDKREDRKK